MSYEETLEKVYNALTFEPQTPNEIAEKIDLNQHTVQVALLDLIQRKISNGRRSECTDYFGKLNGIYRIRKYNGGKLLSILSNRIILSWPALFQIILALIP